MPPLLGLGREWGEEFLNRKWTLIDANGRSLCGKRGVCVVGLEPPYVGTYILTRHRSHEVLRLRPQRGQPQRAVVDLAWRVLNEGQRFARH